MVTIENGSTRFCLFCGCDFQPRNVQQKYCSRACGSKATAEERADKRRGKGKGRYVIRNGMYEHRLVMEQMIGRKLRHGEVVHHRSNNGHDNSPSNLLLCRSQSEHMKLEWKIRKRTKKW
jgi:hypothetical protein